MKKISIFTSLICPYCTTAKKVLVEHGHEYKEIIVDGDQNSKNIMIKKSRGRKTVPQIFIDDFHIGGCEDLIKAINTGFFDKKINEK
tara:strand:+ start:429 stop:689 length:261 start_codon:yes stop_codon:yes gene_type:complete